MWRLLITIIAFAFSGTAFAQQYDWQDYQAETAWSYEVVQLVSEMTEDLADRWHYVSIGNRLERGQTSEDAARNEAEEIRRARASLFESQKAALENLLDQRPETEIEALHAVLGNISAAVDDFIKLADDSFAYEEELAAALGIIEPEFYGILYAAELQADRAADEVYIADRRFWLLLVIDAAPAAFAIHSDIAFVEAINLLRSIEAAFQLEEAESVRGLARELRETALRLSRLSRTARLRAQNLESAWSDETSRYSDDNSVNAAAIALMVAYSELFEVYNTAASVFMTQMSMSVRSETLEQFHQGSADLSESFDDILINVSEAREAVEFAFESLHAAY